MGSPVLTPTAGTAVHFGLLPEKLVQIQNPVRGSHAEVFVISIADRGEELFAPAEGALFAPNERKEMSFTVRTVPMS